MIEEIKKSLHESIRVKESILSDREILEGIFRAAELAASTFKNGNKLLACGNGGSAADAQHIVAELVVKFMKNRKALPALALMQDPSTVSAASNDYGYEHVFERQVEAHGKPGDVLIAISTSGKSPNVNLAVEKAHELGLKIIYLSGMDAPPVSHLCDVVINVPSKSTPRIQESHITIGHIIVDLIERMLFPD